jgi:hypothetical protein
LIAMSIGSTAVAAESLAATLDPSEYDAQTKARHAAAIVYVGCLHKAIHGGWLGASLDGARDQCVAERTAYAHFLPEDVRGGALLGFEQNVERTSKDSVERQD